MTAIALYAAVATVAVVALIYRIAEGAEAWDELVEAIRAWPSETWINIKDYTCTRPRHRMEIDENWGYNMEKAARIIDKRLRDRESEHVQMYVDPERVKICERIRSYQRGETRRRVAIPFKARKA